MCVRPPHADRTTGSICYPYSTLRCSGTLDLSILEVEITEETGASSHTGLESSSAGSKAGQSGDEAVQQRTCPAVAVLGGTFVASQNVAGPPQHALQPVTAATLPPSSVDVATGSQQKGDSKAACKEQTITYVQRNRGTEESAEISVAQRGLVSATAEDTQNLTDTLEGHTPSDRLFESGTDSITQKQDLLYGCKREQTSLAYRETDMAEGSGTGHCQDWSQHPGDAGVVSAPVETEKGPLPPETIKLDYKNMSGKHTPKESPCVPTTEVLPAVSSAVNTADRDMEQSQTTTIFQTNQTSASSAFGIPQKQSTTNSAKQDCKLDSKAAMEVVTRDLAKTDKEGAVSPIKPILGTKQGNSRNSLCSGHSSSKQGGEHITPNSGNSMPNDPDKGSCYSPEVCSKSQKASQRTKTPDMPTTPENTQCVQELSSQYVSLSGTPKVFHLGKETSAREGRGNEKVPVDGDLCLNVAAKKVFCNISVDEPKLSGHGTCTDNVQVPIVKERSQVMVCASSDVILKQNDSASRIEISMSSNHQQDGSVLLTHTENCVALEGLESDLPDCMVQHVQESIPADHKPSQIQICLNDTADIVNVEERQEVSAEPLNAVEVKDLINVGILMQPHMEDTWLVVSEIDGQSEHAEMEVSEASLVQCPESQSTVAVYECTVPCFTSAALHSDVKLLLTDKEEEKPMETLTQDSQAQSNLGNQTSSRPDALKPTEELLTMASTQKEESIIVKQNDDSSRTDLANTLTGLTCTVMDVTLDSVREQQESVVVKNTPGVSLISLSCGTIDPKLLILKKADSPALKQPSSLSARISATQDSPVPVGSPSDGLSKAAECLAKTDTAASSTIKEDAILPADRPVSNTLSQSSRTVSTSNVLSENSSEKENLNKLNSSGKLLQNESSANTSLSTSVQLHNSESHHPPPARDVWGTVSSVVSEGNRCKLRSLAGTPCQDSMSLGGELELEQQQLPDELLSTTQDAQNTILEPLDASIEESSDGEVDSSMEVQNEDSNATPSPAVNKRGQSRTDRQGLLLKVCQWIAGKVTAVSTPSTSPVLCPSPSPSSGDWMRSHTGRASPVRNFHGRNMPSTSSQGYGGCSQSEQTTTPKSTPKHTDMAELAKHEAEIEHRTLALKREGFWSLKRLTRITEPVRPKVHWDYLCEEMQWLSADFAQERRWKRGVARKVVRMVMRHHEELRQKEERAKREEQAKLRRVASSIAKEVRAFWNSVEKVVQYKQQSRLEEKRKKALDLQLDFIVGQTERYSDMLSQSLQAAPVHSSDTAAVSKQSQLNVVDEDDRDFEPPCEEEDDEETIEVEEQQEGNDAETQRREIELLREEGILPLDQLLSTLTLPQNVESEEEASDTTSSTVEEEDKEFSANEEDAEDEEDTIAAQEVIEGGGDHAEELDDLAREGEMSMEELLEKYRGAYASDFEEPSASSSPDSSEESEGTEEEAEEETEGEDSADDSGSSSDSQVAVDSDEKEEDEDVQESNEEDDNDRGEGMEVLLREGDHSPTVPTSPRPKKEISHIAATAESLQPKGYTLATTKVKTPIPFLLHGTLREYQHIGLDWLVTMNEKKLNGILADEMGLGKTIQTIALLAHLACVKGNWGPHLIIVPTSVMLNWEMELKRWCPGFKILTYYGSQKERKLKRQGWTKPNAFHVCITSYKLVLQDHQAFRRKSWRYLILDEAQNIKNFKSQRWQSLLNFNSQRRLLLTGTPLQNSLMELWSLMHFLMPHVFQSHREFKEWFSNPLTGMIEGSQEYNEGLVKRLHKVLRPFLLRRIKADVEKQMPKKYEHVVRCRLSKRQRFLYDDFMAQASTRETLASGHFMSVINILMQLRKVCNHPNLFDPRPIQSPFITKAIVYSTASLVQRALETSPFERCDLSLFDLIALEQRVSRYQADVFLPQRKVTHQLIQEIMESPDPPPRPKPVRMKVNRILQPLPKSDGRSSANSPRPACSSTTTVQTPKPLITEVTPSQAPSQPAPQVCPVTPVAAPKAPVAPSSIPSAPAVRPPAPQPVTVRSPGLSSVTTVSTPPQPPSNIMTQRVLLSPDMQARLPSGEVVSIAQLASLAGRPVSSSQGSKPVTFQLQGNKLTLSGTPLHQVPVPQPRPIQVPTSMVSGPGIVKIVVRQAPSKEGGSIPTLAVPPSPRPAPPQSVTLHPHGTASPVLRAPTASQPPQRPPVYAAPPRLASSQTPPTRPVLRVVQGPLPPAPEPPVTKANSSSVREDSGNDVITLRMSTPKPASSSQSSGSTSQRPRVQPPPPPRSPFYMSWLADSRKAQRDNRISQIMRINDLHCSANPVYGHEVLDFLTFLPGPCPSPPRPVINNWSYSGYSSCLTAQSHHTSSFLEKSHVLKEAIHHSEERLQLLSEIIERFTFVIPPVEAKPITMHTCHPPPSLRHQQGHISSVLSSHLSPLTQTFHRIQCNMRTHFPDLRLIQYDCGKLQTLHLLLRKLKAGGHRVLIFTQMTRMLDILEQFLNYHGHIYLRLDGSTRVEQRQALMERFNADRRIFCFILSTRSGGVGVNLTGADTVVFYDSDWNPTMDAQAQDRCHRIGQTRDVHIYRLISERTVEENILKKANQKRMLGDMAIEGGNFTTAFFKQHTIRELFDVSEGERKEAEMSVPQSDDDESINKQQTTILEQALCRAEDEEDIVAASQAKAEQVAELAEFNENIPLDDGDSRDQEEEELSKAEQEIAALVEQLTPIERYAMNFLEASLEDICKEELKQAEEQVEAARKGLDQAKEEGLKLHQSSDSDEDDSVPPSTEEPTPSRRPRKHKDKGAPSTRVSGRLRGTPADDISLTQPSPERGRRGAWMTSEGSISQSLESTQKPPLHREVPEKLSSDQKGGGTTKESMSLKSSESQTVQTNQQLSDSTALSPTMWGSDPKIRYVPSPHQQPISPSSSVPSTAASPAMDKNSSGHQSSSSNVCREDSEDQGGEPLSESVQCSRRDRRTSASSDSICSPEHHSEQDGQLPLSPTLASPNSRSPRKRQSAEREILKGLPEDSPSAKVLRKLPGRLVTVVEEKEPKRRRRGLSGSGGAHTEGSSEETEQAEPVPEPASQSSDGGNQILKDSSPKSVPTSLASSPPPPQEQDKVSSPLQIISGRGHHPCSPTHHSPDMPVLRNLPVRQRLETESRMAAQLGEQFVGRGKGVDRRSTLSPKKPETNSDKDSAAPSDSMATKRKRGRPPKTPPRALELPEEKTQVTQKTSPEQSPSHSPKRKRGRPRKDSTTTTSSSPSSPSTCAPSFQEPNLSRSNVMPVTLPAISNTSPISSPVNPTSPSNAAEVSSPKLDSETSQKTTSVLLSFVHRDSQNMSSSTSKLGVDSHSETHTNLNPIIACIDSDPSTFETSPHNTSTATISQTCTASSPTLHPPSPLREPPTCTVSIHEEELAHTPVLTETSEITASSEPSNVSTAVETKEDSVNQQKDHLQSPNTLNQVPSQPLHRTSTIEDSPQTSVEHLCNTAASLTPTHQSSSSQPSPSPSLTSGDKLESSSFKSEAPEPTVTLTVSTVQQSTPKSDQTYFPPSQPQTTDIEEGTDSTVESHKMSSTSSQFPSTTNQIKTDSLSTSNYTDADSSQSKNMPVETMADNHEGQHSPKEEVVNEEEVVTKETEKVEIDSVAEDDAGEKDGILSQPKRRKLVSLPKEQTPGAAGVASSNSDIESHDDLKIDGPDKPSVEESREDKETRASAKKRSISRQSSQESVRSSSPSSVSSCGTRSSQSKKAGESRRPAKRKREDIKSEKEKNEEESDKKHQSNSSSSSSDSEGFNSIKKCLTRSVQKKLEKDGMIAENEESSKRQQGRSDKKGKTTNTTEGESSGETCSRVTRKSAGPQPNTLASPEPEVLGKRCSALNAAAKLLAMRGRGPDTPSPRSKTAAQQSKPPSSEKSSKPKGKTGQDSPKMSNSKAASGRQTPNQSSESPRSSSSARSTRQRPGSLVPPLETERVKKEEKKKTSEKEEGEDENRETRSSEGHSACSSISSERGAGSIRSRSSSNSSQRTHSLSSQSTEPTRSRSRAASSGSDTERGKSIWHKRDGGRGRESRKERRSQKQDKPELSAGSSEGTPDRVLRSVAALAAAQARTPASNTRSSSTQNRHSKT
ncbi:helicase SRCAP-like isoform X4 [Cyprinus carpio]|uniref:Helicase SRCAP-like isoform X4 n=1 Tax=Cyprinus carpio TaxID=7962 RepID=A0A9Q9YNW3_CYPCA|nr:helicase SRCAP-like isoform X4 [Cyprinus carpio]